MPRKKIVHRSIRHERTKNCDLEKALADAWERENERALLKQLMGNGQGLAVDALHRDPSITQRDADVAATVFQWLGTNVGSSVLLEAYLESERGRRLIKARARRLKDDE